MALSTIKGVKSWWLTNHKFVNSHIMYGQFVVLLYDCTCVHFLCYFFASECCTTYSLFCVDIHNIRRIAWSVWHTMYISYWCSIRFWYTRLNMFIIALFPTGMVRVKRISILIFRHLDFDCGFNDTSWYTHNIFYLFFKLPYIPQHLVFQLIHHHPYIIQYLSITNWPCVV